jgi:hypothetical protein
MVVLSFWFLLVDSVCYQTVRFLLVVGFINGDGLFTLCDSALVF